MQLQEGFVRIRAEVPDAHDLTAEAAAVDPSMGEELVSVNH